jgi:membrane protease YdiL (CAAX protease family)
MQHFFRFIRDPKYLKVEKIDWSYFFKLFVLLFLIYMVIAPIGFIVSKITDTNEIILNQTKTIVFFLMIIAGPIIEEIMFRLFLRPTNKNLLGLIIFCGLLFINSVIKHKTIFLILSLLVLIVLIYSVSNKSRRRQLQLIVLKHFKILFYLSCLLFGFVHIFNFSYFSFILFVLSPIFLIPKIIAGAILGYVRLKYGIVYSILFHFLINLFPAIYEFFNL